MLEGLLKRKGQRIEEASDVQQGKTPPQVLDTQSPQNLKKSVQDQFLNAARKDGTLVAIFLLNGIKLVGKIDSFDVYVIMLKGQESKQMVYKHAISTVMPEHYTRRKLSE